MPHFLPTFYEQAARVFLRYDNTTYAAAFFGKARDAERVHALDVDEERQRAVFLEFAFAGALTVKDQAALRTCRRRLETRHSGAQFRRKVERPERCGGRVPPVTESLPQDARVLIKAAGLSRTEAECDLLADLIASPAAVRHRSSGTALARLPPWPAAAAGGPAAELQIPRGLEPMPKRRVLATPAATAAPTLRPQDDAFPTRNDDGGAAGVDAADWLSRWAAHRKRGGPVGDRRGTLRTCSPPLRSGCRRRPVRHCFGRGHAGVDLDLLDLCAARGVPLDVPAPGRRVGSAQPLVRATPRDCARLAAVAADPRLRPLLLRAVGAAGHERRASEVLEHIAGHPVLSGVLREWLDGAVDAFTRATGWPGARDPHRPALRRAVGAAVNPIARRPRTPPTTRLRWLDAPGPHP
ncbi:hypothetical protein [Streptomyces sp. DHE17-7]|uniref:hypothetical protein n=1 Tax=Streptomyces sp. DHE17-7 TaxID=2759949 RepID=UPI0022EB9E78|nr:hypothetical protein [Streptomyces sp. DHE17-7]MBJ6618466.1 hypothetical protein [Streptomyces sp. DHE17-7]